jgi:hypothetical protein
MSAVEPAKEAIVRQLQEAVERLQDDIARVEFWTDALGGFAQSIPDYDPASSKLNKFILSARLGETGRASDSAPRRADDEDAIWAPDGTPNEASSRR